MGLGVSWEDEWKLASPVGLPTLWSYGNKKTWV